MGDVRARLACPYEAWSLRLATRYDGPLDLTVEGVASLAALSVDEHALTFESGETFWLRTENLPIPLMTRLHARHRPRRPAALRFTSLAGTASPLAVSRTQNQPMLSCRYVLTERRRGRAKERPSKGDA